MLTCKQVSRALAEENYTRLPRTRRLLLKMHISACIVCGKFTRQLIAFHRAERALLDREEREETMLTVALSDEQKRRIQHRLETDA